MLLTLIQASKGNTATLNGTLTCDHQRGREGGERGRGKGGGGEGETKGRRGGGEGRGGEEG